MLNLNEDLKKKYINYLDNKHYKKLKLEINLLGDVEKIMSNLVKDEINKF